MDMQELWNKALKQTELIRLRAQELPTFETTAVPYIFLAESSLNHGDTVVRRGQVVLERPSIVLPPLSPQFEGFQFDEAMATFLLVRGVRFPSLRYRHEISSLDLLERSLREAIGHFTDQLARSEDITTGLVVGPEEAWQCSVLLLVGALTIRSAQGDVRRIIEAWRARQRRDESHDV